MWLDTVIMQSMTCKKAEHPLYRVVTILVVLAAACLDPRVVLARIACTGEAIMNLSFLRVPVDIYVPKTGKHV
jgi:hypothetical protein